MHILAANIAQNTFLESPGFWEWAIPIILGLCLLLRLAGGKANKQQQRGRR
jgi:hypothetical protein